MWINLKIKPLKKRINSHISPCAYKRGSTVVPYSEVEIDWDHPGEIVTGLPASSLFVYSGYPAVARFITDQKARVVE